MLDLATFASTPLARDPFDHLVVERFLPAARLAGVLADFPLIRRGGSYPPSALSYGPAFDALCTELHADPMRDAFAKKFGVDLAGRPSTLTVRGWTRAKDGKIHTDSKTKLITVLIYLEPTWDHAGGRIRVLRSGKSLDSFTAEVAPAAGTLLAFRNGPTAWHGHTPFVGQRRSMQLNWVVDTAALERSERRHGWSAALKRAFRPAKPR